VLLQFLPEGKHAQSGYSSRAAAVGKRTGAERSGWARHCFEGARQSREPEPRVYGRSDGRQEAENYVSGCPEANRRSPARPLGEMEGRKAEEIDGSTLRSSMDITDVV
jgi:hypothetical protein